LVIKVLNIIDARCNHEIYLAIFTHEQHVMHVVEELSSETQNLYVK